ncbi:Gfo/Idh/MocA family protein [Streptomyces sp. HB132]|uniref:Gfo/Idh/MocA family protein n=1 Tax=Streptomyces sp. HB132 TaxID=767388 RepID=UPI001962143B|nr:Gfo/Idh/MocA family oxidoreductase [Streptomyces sp. HB132]MBM7442935.1 NDP-hexose-3-ketoreductase [Streptomyces sp. HB132]
MDSPHQSGPVRIGVLGASSIAWRRTLPALREVPDSTVVAVASREKDKAERFAARFDCAAVHGYEALLERDDIDAVYVSVPNSLHHQWVHRLLMCGKHVLAEKPLTTRPADTAALVELAAHRRLVLRENIAFVHHGLHRRVAELVGAGRIGRLRHIDAAFCFPPLPETDVRYRADLGGGALLDAGLYPVRLAQYFLGNELTVAGAVLREDPAAGVDVAGSAVLAAATGETVTLSFGFEHSYGASYTLWGSSGRLSVDRAFTPPPTMAPLIRIDEQDHAEEITLPAEHQFARSAESFVKAVSRSRSSGSDPDHDAWAATALRTAELLDRIATTAHRVVAGKQV